MGLLRDGLLHIVESWAFIGSSFVILGWMWLSLKILRGMLLLEVSDVHLMYFLLIWSFQFLVSDIAFCWVLMKWREAGS